MKTNHIPLFLTLLLTPLALQATEPVAQEKLEPADKEILNFHIMHPGGGGGTADPNAAFYLDGTYHLHYILAYPWKEKGKYSCSYIHLTSPDMLHWTWQPTKLQPSFTDHGMYSGVGFMTKQGKPAVMYLGQNTGQTFIAIAKDNQLSAWEKPYSVDVRKADGTKDTDEHADPECWLVGDTYYAMTGGGRNPPLIKSKDLKTWTRVGNFLQKEMPDVTVGEDLSCGSFFPIGNKWMLLCISHPVGCRYYLGDWDAQSEKFIPQFHGRMNWRRDDQSIYGTQTPSGQPHWRVDYFAPESLLTPDGRRVVWAWLASLNDVGMNPKRLQSLPRELSLPEDGILRIKPLRELETLRFDPAVLNDVKISDLTANVLPTTAPTGQKIAALEGDAVEVRVTIPRQEANRKLFGFTLFSTPTGGGLPIMFRPETGTLRVGNTEAPFNLATLPGNEDIDLRIFIDKYLVEVFVNDRQAMVASYADYAGKHDLTAFTVGAPTTLKKVEIWKLKPTNQGFLEARKNRVWEPNTK